MITSNIVYLITSESKGLNSCGFSLVAKNYLIPMVEKVKSKHSMDCEVKVLTRKKNTPNEAVYEELHKSISTSFSGVVVSTSFHV